MSWTAETFYSEFCKQILMCQMGDHTYLHKVDIDTLRNRCKTLKGKAASNLCYLTEDELIEGMKAGAKEWAEDMASWLNSPIRLKGDWEEYFDYDFNRKIGQLVIKPSWSNEYIETKGSVLIVALAKLQTREGGFTFKITTEYCDWSYKEESVEKEKRGL